MDKVLVKKIQKPKDYSTSEIYENNEQVAVIFEKRKNNAKRL